MLNILGLTTLNKPIDDDDDDDDDGEHSQIDSRLVLASRIMYSNKMTKNTHFRNFFIQICC